MKKLLLAAALWAVGTTAFAERRDVSDGLLICDTVDEMVALVNWIDANPRKPQIPWDEHANCGRLRTTPPGSPIPVDLAVLGPYRAKHIEVVLAAIKFPDDSIQVGILKYTVHTPPPEERGA